MNVFEKIKEKLKQEFLNGDFKDCLSLDKVFKIIDQVAEEYNNSCKIAVNPAIKNPFANVSTVGCMNCDHKDEYIVDLEQKDGWISVNDRLPEEETDEYMPVPRSERVLVTVKDYEKGDYFVSDDYTLGGEWQEYREPNKHYRVVAWKSYPEPYKP